MKNLKKAIIPLVLFLVALGNYGCTDKFDEINTDKTKLVALDEAGIGNAFASAQYNALSVSGNWQLFNSLFSDLQVQFYANVAPYFPSD